MEVKQIKPQLEEEKRLYSYEELKAICEVIKYSEDLGLYDYEEIIVKGLELYSEWVQESIIYNVGLSILTESEYAYSQEYIANRVQRLIEEKERNRKSFPYKQDCLDHIKKYKIEGFPCPCYSDTNNDILYWYIEYI